MNDSISIFIRVNARAHLASPIDSEYAAPRSDIPTTLYTYNIRLSVCLRTQGGSVYLSEFVKTGQQIMYSWQISLWASGTVCYFTRVGREIVRIRLNASFGGRIFQLELALIG